MDVAGFGTLNALRLSKRGSSPSVVLTTLESVQQAVGLSMAIPLAAVDLGVLESFDYRMLAGKTAGGFLNLFAKAPGIGMPLDVAGASISCGSAAYAWAIDFLAVP